MYACDEAAYYALTLSALAHLEAGTLHLDPAVIDWLRKRAAKLDSQLHRQRRDLQRTYDLLDDPYRLWIVALRWRTAPETLKVAAVEQLTAHGRVPPPPLLAELRRVLETLITDPPCEHESILARTIAYVLSDLGEEEFVAAVRARARAQLAASAAIVRAAQEQEARRKDRRRALREAKREGVPPPPLPAQLSTAQVAAELSMSVPRVRALIKSGVLPARRSRSYAGGIAYRISEDTLRRPDVQAAIAAAS